MTKTILITGGTGKVGTQLVNHFLSKGYYVITTSRRKEKLEELKSKVEYKERFYPIIIDLEEKDAAQTIYTYCENENLKVNTIINNARDLSYLSIKNGKTERKNWLGEYTLDVIVPYELAMQFSEHSAVSLQSIVNISSMYGVVAPNPSLYTAFSQQSPINYGVSKAAQIHLTKELAVRLAKKKIAVNSVSYGGIKGRVDGAFQRRYAKLTPSEEMLDEEDVIGAVDFLVSPKAKHINGHNIIVDGGWTIW